MLFISSERARIPLSVNIIGTKTNRRILDAVLKSIASIADEIVIIADESADNAFYRFSNPDRCQRRIVK